VEPGDLQRPRTTTAAVLAGARLIANYPISVITDGMGLNITVMSYCGISTSADLRRDQMPDVHLLIQWLAKNSRSSARTDRRRLPGQLADRVTAVHGHRETGDELGLVTGKEEHRVAHIVGSTISSATSS